MVKEKITKSVTLNYQFCVYFIMFLFVFFLFLSFYFAVGASSSFTFIRRLLSILTSGLERKK